MTMQLDALTISSREGRPRTRVRVTLRHPRIRSLQRRHFCWLTAFPGLVTCIALASLLWHRPTPIAFGLAGLMWLVTGVGVTVGYHRLFTHRSFKTTRGVSHMLVVAGMMAAPGPLLPWVATHRRHHSLSDRDGDPHSPNLCGAGLSRRLKGLLHAQFGWMREHDFPNPFFYCRDLLREGCWQRLDRRYYVIVLGGLLVPALIAGVVCSSFAVAADVLLWAGLVRLFVVQSIISSVNSVCHRFGTRPFDTPEQSRNNWVVAVAALGEGWHNNHHAFQTSASLGLHWWEFDPGGLVVRGLALVGLAWDVKLADAGKVAARRRSSNGGGGQP